MAPVFKTVLLDELRIPDWGWRYRDSSLEEKLATSLRHHGQLRAVVARREHGVDGLEVVDGRALVRAMRAEGLRDVAVCDVGELGTEAAVALGLALELRFETDYAQLAAAVALLVVTDDWPTTVLARSAPFTSAQLDGYVALASFDWAQFSQAPDGQGGLEFGAEADVPLPPPNDEPALPPPPPEPAVPAAVPVQAAPEAVPEPAAAPAPVEAPRPGPPPQDAPAPGDGPQQRGLLFDWN